MTELYEVGDAPGDIPQEKWESFILDARKFIIDNEIPSFHDFYINYFDDMLFKHGLVRFGEDVYVIDESQQTRAN